MMRSLRSGASQVAPATATDPRSSISSTASGTDVGTRNRGSGRVKVGLHGGEDRGVAGAAAEVPGHERPHLFPAGTGPLPSQGVRRDHGTRSTDSALHAFVLHEGVDESGV